jgi:DsbC/DsbD-like thiol-disulfide interchange protein
VPKKTKSSEDTNQTAPDSDAPATTKKTSKRQTPRRATTAKKPHKPRDASERTAHISASPQADVTLMSGEPSDDAVRLRAYFISERRRRFALPGDAESDWLEAKRQLLAEARR